MPMLFSKKHPLSRPLENLARSAAGAIRQNQLCTRCRDGESSGALKAASDINLADVTPIKWVEGLSTIDGYCVRDH